MTQLERGPGLASRISSLDVLRGFALLGILLMNIQSFSMPIAAYFNPTAYGDFSGANAVTWLLVHVFVDQKFISLFSILFGASILLFTLKAEEKGAGVAALHYRRNLWLLVFGLAHAYLLWYGDILYTYAIMAFLLYPFRNAGARRLFIAGVVVFGVATLIGLAAAATFSSWPSAMVEDARAHWDPTPEQLDAEVAAYEGGWLAQMAHRVGLAFFVETEVLLTFYAWKTGGLMLIGMALFKWGVLSAERTPRLYRRLALYGFGLGIPIILAGVAVNVSADWSLAMSLYSSHFNYWGSLFMALGYIGLVMLAVKANLFAAFQARLAAVGRTAFTNYLLQTLIGTTIFYGHGLGLFGSIDRVGQVLVCLGIWTLQLVLSPWWLRHFTFGPLEWLWRTLTYLRVQPLRLAPTATPQGAVR